MSLIRGVLLAGGFRAHRELNAMSAEDQRNTLITELAKRTANSVEHYQGMGNDVLAGAGAVLVLLRLARIRDDAELKLMSDEDIRNTAIVEVGIQTGATPEHLQSFKNVALVLECLRDNGTFIHGVLLAGRFRTQKELSGMSSEDQRNTLITELTARTNRPVNHYQEMSDFKLAGAGAVLVLLRSGQIRADTDLKKMSDEDARNTAIVEINTQTGVPIDQLQAFSNLALVSVAVTGNLSAARTLDLPPTTPAPLPNPVNGPLHFDTGPLTSNEPLGGSAHFVVERNGNFTLITHAHDSGFNNIEYTLGVTLLCHNGQAAFGAGVKGHVEGTMAGLPFGTPDRNDDQTILGNDPRITAMFDSIVAGSSLHGRLDGQDTFVGGIQDAIGEAFTDGAKAFGVELGKGLAVIVLKGGTPPG